ncbi:PREDICTED: GTPase IMAP family member 7-like [Poecilia mexicana]|uniref:GTPase IMAP family member 7-like n=1 Tax=Poecilia mexicana TaxID=48701 RepID=UPI00072E42E1|nr:PREDICTED: GTPase IMAP family member 7-like [Poecilia mexicana]
MFFSYLLVRLRRIAIIGQTGAGKSSLGNTIFKEQKFKVNHDVDPGMSGCEAKTKRVGGREITLIDMPGLFDPEKDEKQLKAELLKGITECSPGPHAFLIVLNVEKSTEKDNDIVSKMNEHFSEEVFKYSTVVFTHGDQLPRRKQIQGFVKENKFLSDLVEKCGNRCHVVDNKRWNKRSKYSYRSNRYQVKKLLKSIEKTVEENDGSFYTNAMLQKIEENIKEEEEDIAKSSRNISEEQIGETAKERVYNDFLIKAAGVTTGALLGAVFGSVVAVVAVLPTSSAINLAKNLWSGTVTKPASDSTASAAPDKTGEAEKEANVAAETGEPPTAMMEKEADTAAAEKPLAAQKVATVEKGKAVEAAANIRKEPPKTEVMKQVGVTAVAGAFLGGVAGYKAAEKAKTPWEAAEKAAQAVSCSGFTAIEKSIENL